MTRANSKRPPKRTGVGSILAAGNSVFTYAARDEKRRVSILGVVIFILFFIVILRFIVFIIGA